MIEQEIIKQYPTLVARSYLLIKDDFQRKDMQRFWFENTISFLAVLSAAELVKFYKDLKSKESKSDKDFKIIQALQENKSLTMVGLEHMALGKWVMMLRETTKTLQEFNVATTIPELVEFYYGKKGKENAKLIDKLVSIRNDDAHGNPIPEDKLNAELDKRQKLIDSLLEELDFLKNYQLILPEKLEIEGSKQFYICKHFIGESIVNTKESFDFSPQLSDVMLVNNTKKDVRLSLSPLLLYLGVQDEENNFLGIFSKYVSKDETEAKYLNLDGSATIDLINFGQNQDLDLIAKRQSYSEIYADPESFQVKLDISMKLENSQMDIKNKDDLVINSFSLLLENKKSADIEKLRILLNIPKNIDILIKPLKDKPYVISQLDGQLVIEFNSFENGETIETEPIEFTVSEQGSYAFDGGQALYSYYMTLADKESDQLTEEDIVYEGETVEANDPNSRDKMVPVINMTKDFVDVNGESIQSVKIGEDFIFRVHVFNIGFSSAKDVTIDLVFPNHVNLKQGKETIKLGQLNPFEERTFEYVLNSQVPGIYTISMQNILYSDSQKVRYATRCADDYFIIVRSDLIKEFVFSVKEYIDDLYIDIEEKAKIKEHIEKLNTSIDINAYDLYKEAETEAVIKIIRDLIEKTALKKDLKVVEKIYEEGKRDSKITGVNPRKFLVYSSKEMPFFAINLSKGYEPEFFALRTNIDKRFDKVGVKQAVVGEGSYTLDHCIDFSDIKYNEKYGKDFFSQWLNIVLSKFTKEYTVWKNIANNISDQYGVPQKYVSGNFSGYPSSSIESGAKYNIVSTLIDRDISNSFFVVFDVSSTNHYKKVMKEKMLDKSYITFLIAAKKKTRLYDSKNLSYYFNRAYEDKITRFPAVNFSVKDDRTMNLLMDKTKELWESLCLAHSLNLLDSDSFKNQKFKEEMMQFTHLLFERGFALRQNTKSNDMLDIYPLKYFKPHTATELDCIGVIRIHRSAWQIFMDFFEDTQNDVLISELSLISSSTMSYKVHWIKADIHNKEQLEIVMDAVLRQAQVYKPSSLAIWPVKMQREMIINHGQTDVGFLILLKNILSGKNKYIEILQEFKSMGLDTELDRTLKRCEMFKTDMGYESPFCIEGEGKDIIIEYKAFLEGTLKKMLEEEPEFDYLKEGTALYRIQVKQISQGCKLLSNRSPAPTGYVDFSIKKINSPYFNTCAIGISSGKNKKIGFYSLFHDCKEEAEEKIKEKYSSLNQSYNNKFIFKRSGTDNRHFRVSYTYQFANFNNELGKIKEICNEFMKEFAKIAESFSEEG